MLSPKEFGLAMLLQRFRLVMLHEGNFCRGYVAEVQIGYATGKDLFQEWPCHEHRQAVFLLPAPITHFFRRGNSYGLMGGWEHARRLPLHKLLEQSNQIDVDKTSAGLEQNLQQQTY